MSPVIFFYIIIDYDKPVDEDGEQYQTYFLSVVDEADLLAAAEAAGIELPVCECTDKCMAGAVNTDCPVCATNMTECAGAAPVVEPTADPEPMDDPEPEQPKEENNSTGTIILIVAVALNRITAPMPMRTMRGTRRTMYEFHQQPLRAFYEAALALPWPRGAGAGSQRHPLSWLPLLERH